MSSNQNNSKLDLSHFKNLINNINFDNDFELSYDSYEYYNEYDWASGKYVSKTRIVTKKRKPNPDKNPINKEFLEACTQNDIEKVKDMLFNSTNPPNIHTRYYEASGEAEIDACLEIAASKNYEDLLKFFLEDKRVCHQFDLTRKAHSLAYAACGNGHLNILSYLGRNKLTKDLIQYSGKERVNLLVEAARNNHVHIMDYLLHSKDIPQNSKIDDDDNWIYVHSCSEGALDAVKMIAEYGTKKNFHTMNDMPFINCYRSKDREKQAAVLNFLIFDLQLELTEEIQKVIKDDEETKNKFKLRELNNKLENKLNVKERDKKLKI